MKRVVLIIAAVLIGLMGLQSTLSGLGIIFFGGIGNLLGGAMAVGAGGGLLYAARLILRSQMGDGDADAESRERRRREGMRVFLTVLALFAGLVGLLFSLCGVLFSGSSGSDGAGWFIAIGVVLLGVAIILVVKAVRMR